MSRQVLCFIPWLAYSDHRQFRTLMLIVSVLALPPLVPVASPSCSRLVTAGSEMVTQAQRLNNASPMTVPTELCSSPNSPPLAHSECALTGV